MNITGPEVLKALENEAWRAGTSSNTSFSWLVNAESLEVMNPKLSDAHAAHCPQISNRWLAIIKMAESSSKEVSSESSLNLFGVRVLIQKCYLKDHCKSSI